MTKLNPRFLSQHDIDNQGTLDLTKISNFASNAQGYAIIPELTKTGKPKAITIMSKDEVGRLHAAQVDLTSVPYDPLDQMTSVINAIRNGAKKISSTVLSIITPNTQTAPKFTDLFEYAEKHFFKPIEAPLQQTIQTPEAWQEQASRGKYTRYDGKTALDAAIYSAKTTLSV